MKLIVNTSYPKPASNLTNEEFIRHVECEFPNLSGTLLQLLKRFEKYAYDDTLGNEDKEFFTENVQGCCPNCGTSLRLEE